MTLWAIVVDVSLREEYGYRTYFEYQGWSKGIKFASSFFDQCSRLMEMLVNWDGYTGERLDGLQEKSRILFWTHELWGAFIEMSGGLLDCCQLVDEPYL